MSTVLAITTNKYLILLICILLMVAVGCVMDATAAMLVFIPVLTPLQISSVWTLSHFACCTVC